MNNKRVFTISIFGLLLASCLVAWFLVLKESPHSLKVYFLDVGQGDAVFIETPNGNQILVDGGPSNGKAVKELSKIMPFYDRTIDMVLASHPHADHIGGLNEVFERYKVSLVVDSGVAHKTSEYEAYQKNVKNEKAKYMSGERGMAIKIDNEVYLDILLPIQTNANLAPHDGMLVLKLRSPYGSVFFSGDMEMPLEKYLASLHGNIKSAILKVGHHGSKTSTSDEILEKVQPEYAVIPVGKDNKYGHPNLEVLKRLRDLNIKTFRTDEDGTVEIIFDEKGLKIPKNNL